MDQETTPGVPPATGGVAPTTEGLPPAPPPVAPAPPPVAPVGWAPATAGVAAPYRERSVTGLAKLGSLVLFLGGLFWTAIGLLIVLAGGLVRDALRDLQIEGLTEGDAGNILGGLFAGIGVVIVVVSVFEILVGILSWRGSGVGRVMGILYGLFFGGLSLTAFQGTSSADLGTASPAGGVLALVIAVAYLYTALVFIFKYRRGA